MVNMKKTKFLENDIEIEIDLEEKDWALIEALRELSREIRATRLKNG